MKNTISLLSLILIFVSLPFFGNAQRLEILVDAPSVVIQGGEFDVTYVVRRPDQKNVPLQIGKEFFDQCNCVYLASEESSEIKKIKGVRIREISVRCHLKATSDESILLPSYELSVGRRTISSAESVVQVRPNEKYNAEYKAAIAGIKRIGINTENIALEQCDANANLMLFSSDRKNITVLVASAKYYETLSDPILMWSDQNVLHSFEEIRNFVSFYDDQLENTLLSNNRFIFKPETVSVDPLLKKLSWGTGEPYNIKCPEYANVSRSAVALTQLLSFYRYPTNLVGETTYRRGRREVLERDFTTQGFAWGDAMDYFQTHSDLSLQALGTILETVSVAVHSDFGGDKDWPLERIPYALINHLDYKSTCRIIRDNKPERMISLLYSEINEQRPAIVELVGSNSSLDYAVCDGYKSDYLHLVFANQGKCNGWYKASLSTSPIDHVISGVVIGIQPNDGRKIERSITLTKPNTLSTLLNESDKKEITSLKIIGKISNDDIRLLRRMAGAVSVGEYSWFGQLEKLDLSEASIVPVANTYYYEQEGRYLQESRTNTSNSLMNQMIGIFISRGGCEYDEVSKTARFYSVKNVIGDYMFAGCQNLKEIILPAKTTKIGEKAFSGCISLPVIDLPSTVTEIGDEAFSHTWSMQHVNLHSNPKKYDSERAFIDSSLGNQGFFLLR